MGLRLCLDDVGIGASATDVVGAHPVIIERIRSQAGHVLISHVADIQILISRHVSAKRFACGDVQAVTGRTADAGPARSEAAGGLVGVV